jgi:hypothetical protein
MTTERATREQIGRIVSMLVSGQTPFDLAQAIATNGVRIMTEQEKYTVYLEKCFPGYGKKLMKVLGLLFSWEPTLRVPPKEIDLSYMLCYRTLGRVEIRGFFYCLNLDFQSDYEPN